MRKLFKITNLCDIGLNKCPLYFINFVYTHVNKGRAQSHMQNISLKYSFSQGITIVKPEKCIRTAVHFPIRKVIFFCIKV